MHDPMLFVYPSCLVPQSGTGDPFAALNRHVDSDGFRLDPFHASGYDGGPKVHQLRQGPATMHLVLVPSTMQILTVERIEFPVPGLLGLSRIPDIWVGERTPDERTVWHFRMKLTRAAR